MFTWIVKPISNWLYECREVFGFMRKFRMEASDMEHEKSYEKAAEELSLMSRYMTREQDNNEFCRYRESSFHGVFA